MTGGSDVVAQRVIQRRFGDPVSVLTVEALPPPALSAGEVRVRVNRASIHPGDLQLVAGAYAGAGDEIPSGRVPGTEGAGVIEEAAPDALGGVGLREGSRVAFFASAAWQSLVVVPADLLVAVPDEVSEDVAAQILTNTITAHRAEQRGFVGRVGLDQHDESELARTQLVSRRVAARSGAAAMHPPPVQPFHELSELRRGQAHDAVLDGGPAKGALLQPLRH